MYVFMYVCMYVCISLFMNISKHQPTMISLSRRKSKLKYCFIDRQTIFIVSGYYLCTFLTTQLKILYQICAVYMCVCVCVCVYVCVYIHICMYICKYNVRMSPV